MAAHERPAVDLRLVERLEPVLPRGTSFKLHHVSTPPERASPIYHAPPGQQPERSYCESQFLAVSIIAGSKEVLAFAIEIFIYTTASYSTFFVSKADSTGYLGLLKVSKEISPIKVISTEFLGYLLDSRRRIAVPSIVSLFARSQDQYLFPGSIDNKGKHVLDDRGLVRWWCRVLDPINKHNPAAQAHLLVPGLDKYETMGLLPSDKAGWAVGHPLKELFAVDLPPRCVIPHFPDDPKARFLDELDDEIEGSEDGMWKSVKTLDQFWEMMEFRQECSAGRLVGFIWVVIKPDGSTTNQQGSSGSQLTTSTIESKRSNVFDRETPGQSFSFSSQTIPEDAQLSQQSASSRVSKAPRSKKKLSGIIQPRQPKIKTQNRRHKKEIPELTPYYTWPTEGRGEIIVSGKEYKKLTELLLHLDFEDLEHASSSTRRWIEEVGRGWGQEVTGTKIIEVQAAKEGGVAVLSSGLVRKKRKVEEPQVNVLSGMMVKKKAKS